MKAKDIKGVYTALITPFDNNKIDSDAFASLCEWQIESGVHGLVAVGTTGESPTLSHDEHKHVVELCVKAAKGRVPVMAGTGSNSTAEAIEFTKHAADSGADMALVVSPYYNKPTPEGLFQHFKAVHDSADIPIIIYNIPGRSVIDISDELLAKLGELKNVIGVKDATGDLARVSSLRKYTGDSLALLSGEDMTAIAFNAMGGNGCISVTANVAPDKCSEVQNACLKGDYKKALEIHEPMISLHQAMFLETSPIPVKYALHRMGKCKQEIRLPLVTASESVRKNVDEAMIELDLI